jgi:hypothetical protein
MKIRRISSLCAALVGVLIAAVTSRAGTATFGFQATVAEVRDLNLLLGGAVHEGDTITGTFTFNTAAVDKVQFANLGSYDFTSGLGVAIKAGGLSFRSDPNNVRFHLEIGRGDQNASGHPDRFLFRSYNNLALNATTSVDHIAWQIEDATATAISSAKLPTINANLSQWNSVHGLTIQGRGSADGQPDYFIRAHLFKIYSVPNGTLP